MKLGWRVEVRGDIFLTFLFDRLMVSILCPRLLLFMLNFTCFEVVSARLDCVTQPFTPERLLSRRRTSLSVQTFPFLFETFTETLSEV